MDWLLEQSEAGGRAAPRSAVLVGGDGDLVLQALSMQARSMRAVELHVLRSVPSLRWLSPPYSQGLSSGERPNPNPNPNPSPNPNPNPNPNQASSRASSRLPRTRRPASGPIG